MECLLVGCNNLLLVFLAPTLYFINPSSMPILERLNQFIVVHQVVLGVKFLCSTNLCIIAARTWDNLRVMFSDTELIAIIIHNARTTNRLLLLLGILSCSHNRYIFKELTSIFVQKWPSWTWWNWIRLYHDNCAIWVLICYWTIV